MSSLTDELLNMPGPGTPLPILTDRPAPFAAPPTSSIDPTVPVYGSPTTESVRDNFATAATEITALMQATQGGPFMPLAGGHFTGPMYLFNDPTDVMMPVTLGYFNAHGGGGSGGGGIPEAPTDGKLYTRSQGAWVPGVGLSGGTYSQMTGELLLAANPTSALGAVPKQYADAIATTANGAVPLAGGTMTGLLILSGDPTAALGAVTKQYHDAGLALKAPIANPTFTGIVTTASRIIAAGPSGPSLTLYDTTTSRPCFGVYNTNGYLSFGLAVAASGNPNGAPFATLDQSGNWLFSTRVNVTGGRLISSGAPGSQPSVTINPGGSAIYGLWSSTSTNLMAIGLMDASGAPQTALASIDSAGDWNLISGNLTINNTSSVALNVPNGGINVGGPLGVSGAVTFAGSGTALSVPNGTTQIATLHVTGNARIDGSFYSAFYGGDIRLQGNLFPNADNSFHCGISGVGAWSEVVSYLYTTLSDAALKTDIDDLPDCLGLVDAIAPRRYRWREGADTDRTHWGFVAQDVASAMQAARYDFGGHNVENGQHTLAYGEMTAVLWKACQELWKECRQLTARVAALETAK